MAMIYFPVVSFPLEAEEQPAFVVNPAQPFTPQWGREAWLLLCPLPFLPAGTTLYIPHKPDHSFQKHPINQQLKGKSRHGEQVLIMCASLEKNNPQCISMPI